MICVFFAEKWERMEIIAVDIDKFISADQITKSFIQINSKNRWVMHPLETWLTSVNKRASEKEVLI
jgi:hypothetical protein